jgi:hypothetical protein
VSPNSRHVSFPVGKTENHNFFHTDMTVASYLRASGFRILA